VTLTGRLLERRVPRRLSRSAIEAPATLQRNIAVDAGSARTDTELVAGMTPSGIDPGGAARTSSELVASFALLDALVSDSPVALGFWDTDLRYRRLNERMAQMAGAPVEAHLGRTLPEMLGPLGERLEASLRDVLACDEAVADLELSGTTAAEPDRVRHWRVSFYPVDTTNHTALGVGATVVDITAERDAAEHHRRTAERERRAHEDDNATRDEVLGRASAALSTLRRDDVLDALVAALVPELADWCTIHVAEPAKGLRLLAVAHRDPRRARLAQELASRYPLGALATAGAAAVIRSGRREVHTEIADALFAPPADDESLRVLRELGLHSAVVLPLRAGRRVLGALTLAMGDSGRHYTGETLELAESVAAQAATALDNARLYAEQADIAHALQQELLPPTLPAIDGIDLAACYRPKGRAVEVGGDFYDVFAAGDGAWRLLIGDVVGKGPQAASLTALVRYTLRGAELAPVGPTARLGWVNDELMRRSPAVDFCSAVYGTMSVGAGRAHVELISCGHPPPLVRRANGRVDELRAAGPLLGVGPDPRYLPSDVDLAPGDVLLFYTDGVIELPGRNPWRGVDLLHSTLRSAGGLGAQELVDHIERVTLDACRGTPRDDLALLAVRVL
jgi:serine phosphatase RsbU (regulator of sigma subunit)/PAS domain-containing protein